LGVTDSTPKTPITTTHSNPFDSIASTSTSRGSVPIGSSGVLAHSSRHSLATSATGISSSRQPLTSSGASSSKHSSLLSSTSSLTRHQVAEPPKKDKAPKGTVTAQPTNILRMTKVEPTTKKHVRKPKTQQPQTETGNSLEPTKKKKKKTRKVKDVRKEEVEGQVAQDEPTSLKVQLPKQIRPNDLVLTEVYIVVTLFAIVYDAVVLLCLPLQDIGIDSVSNMLRELMNPLPPSLVTPIRTPLQSNQFTFSTKK